MPLRLKSLELQGYKTFASRTLFEFAGGITAIVGPNGSGKSNIADSLRWVLGEQSYTLLRGKKTEDMIFGGSEHRPRAGMAQAAVTFNNGDQWLPVDFSEVELSRHAYRDGRNEYLLNGHHVRLREINELLAQAGLSERTYTILGQGLVDASLALKADERRRLFEEAAGVGLYRARREEALKRLDHTERNLERVLDIMTELEPRLRSLERQARRAIEYGRVQADLKLTLLQWYGYHWHRGGQDLAAVRDTVHQQELRVDEARSAYEQAQAEYSTFRERLIELRGQLNVWHRQSAELHNRREAISRELAVLEERRRSLTVSRQAAQSDHERAADELRLGRERLAQAEAESQRLGIDLEEARGQHAEADRALQTRQSAQASLEQQITRARVQLEALVQRRVESQARLDELKSRGEVQAQKIEQSARAIETARQQARTAEERYAAARAEREAAEAVLKQAEADAESRRQAVEKIEAQRREVLEDRARQEAEHSRLRAQLEVLEQAEQSLAGYADGARFLLDAARQDRLSGARGALSGALDVPAELETAISAALGDQIDAVLFEGNELEEALQLLEADDSGRAALLPLRALAYGSALPRQSDADVLGIASELVNAPDDLREAVNVLLGQILVVRNRTAARRALKDLPIHARVVTLRGEVFRGDGLIIAGKTASSSTLSRPRQKRELESALAGLARRLDESNAAVERLSGELAVAQRELGQAEAAARERRARLEVTQTSERQAGLDSESARRQLTWQGEQHEQLEAEAAEAAALRQSLLDALAGIEGQSAEAQAGLESLSGKLSQATLDELQQRVAYWATRLAVAEQSMDAARASQAERAAEATRLHERQSELHRRSEEAAGGLTGLEADKAALREQEGALHAQIEELRTHIEPGEKDLETAEQQEARLQEVESSAQRGFASAERMLGQVQLEHTRRQESLDNLRQRIMDDFGLVEFQYIDDVSGPVPLPFEGMVEQLPVITELPLELEDQLNRQRAQLRRMGPINPEAKQEFDKESERYSFLKTQVDDLRKAESDLKEVIAELDTLTKREFSRTFEAVDKRFRETFVRLFGGGSARLSLTDPENLVETGIEIEARLPGRREQGLALLSGGERSLTAIALVFALLKVSPTPVCVMDEVDAMLDEANVGRFRDLLVELSQDTQFIIITHNRNTVQAADVIYGVTMGRDSTSQIISLRLDQVTEEMLTRG